MTPKPDPNDIEKKILRNQIFRKKYGRPILISLLILLVVLGGVYIPKFVKFVHNVCTFKEYQEFYSPDAQNKILAYTLICSSDIYTEISILDKNTMLTHDHGNVFSALGNPIEFEINTRWEDNHHIMVESNGKATPYFMENHIGDIEIEYAIVHRTPTQRTPFYLTTSTRTFTPTPIRTLASTSVPTSYLQSSQLPSRTPTITPSP
jgi:hypothetical protein